MQYYVYFMANESNSTIYVGVTNNLLRRVYEHKNSLDKHSFTSRYKTYKLVYYEYTGDVKTAIEREKQIKGWNRQKKNKIISAKNPHWKDLYEEIKDSF